MNDHKLLEVLALDCHRVGSTWEAFWHEHGARVRQAEPFDPERLHRLVRRLLAIVVSGDTCGQDDDAPCHEDGPEPSAMATKAKCLIELRAIPGIVFANEVTPCQ